MSLSDGYLLARSVVNIQHGLKIENPKRVDELCWAVFGQSIDDFRPKKKLRNGFVELPSGHGEYGDLD